MQTIFPLILSNTDMELWSQCKLRWFRERCQWLRKQSFNIDLTAGAAFAKGMELARKAYYQDRLAESDAIDLGYESILENMHTAMLDQDTDVLKSPERMARALKAYFKRFPLECEEVIPAELEDGSFAVEHKFTVELPILHPELQVPLIFKGKLDMLAQYLGRAYIVDEKTTKQISSNTGDLLQASGQFIGYSYLAREHGITIQATKVRKVCIQVKDIKIEEFENPITPFMIDSWEQAMLAKVRDMVYLYSSFISEGNNFRKFFLPDYQGGCTSFFRPCTFIDGCTSKYGDTLIESQFQQIVWDSVEQQEMPLAEYREKLGLEN